jgi:selenocysteine lyase/cysteine desulfurase
MIPDVEGARRETPGCKNVLYFNNAGSSLMPEPVLRATVGQLELEARMGGYEAAARGEGRGARLRGDRTNARLRP